MDNTVFPRIDFSGIRLEVIKKSDSRMARDRSIHYSQPKGFVGRSICYAVLGPDSWGGHYFGSIVGGSATLHLDGRNQFFGLSKDSGKLNQIINNIFYHVEPTGGKYPTRNFTPRVLRMFRERAREDWFSKYGDEVLGYESLVELPRKGDLYLRDHWSEVGETKGFTCKRVGGQGTDSWSGKRVWDLKNLRPKRVFCRWVDEEQARASAATRNQDHSSLDLDRKAA